MFEVIACGEPMVLFSPVNYGPLRHVASFTRHVAGAELNFSVALARLGLSVGYVTRVGQDEFGRCVLASMREEALDTRLVKVDPERRTGVYFKEYNGLGDPLVYYYRDGSAASAMGPDDIDPSYLDGARLVHVTGITPLLSETCREATEKLFEAASARNVPVSFDPNVRLKLVAKNRVPEAMLTFVRQARVLFMNEAELDLVLGVEDPLDAARELKGVGPELLVVKHGANGATAVDLATGRTAAGAPFQPGRRYVDPVGAGDGFDAGFVFGYLRGWSLEESLRLGNFIGALATTVSGDYEGYPLYSEVESAGLVPERAAD